MCKHNVDESGSYKINSKQSVKTCGVLVMTVYTYILKKEKVASRLVSKMERVLNKRYLFSFS